MAFRVLGSFKPHGFRESGSLVLGFGTEPQSQQIGGGGSTAGGGGGGREEKGRREVFFRWFYGLRFYGLGLKEGGLVVGSDGKGAGWRPAAYEPPRDPMPQTGTCRDAAGRGTGAGALSESETASTCTASTASWVRALTVAALRAGEPVRARCQRNRPALLRGAPRANLRGRKRQQTFAAGRGTGAGACEDGAARHFGGKWAENAENGRIVGAQLARNARPESRSERNVRTSFE